MFMKSARLSLSNLSTSDRLFSCNDTYSHRARPKSSYHVGTSAQIVICIGLLLNTLIRSYSLIATFFASSVTLMVSFNSSIFRILDLSPPNTFDDAASSFSVLACSEESSERSVCTVSKALDLSANAPWTAIIMPR